MARKSVAPTHSKTASIVTKHLCHPVVLDTEIDWDNPLSVIDYRASAAARLCQLAANEVARKRLTKSDELCQSSKLWRAIDNLNQAQIVVASLVKELELITGWSVTHDGRGTA